MAGQIVYRKKGDRDSVNFKQKESTLKAVQEKLPRLTSRLAEEKGRTEPDELLIADLEQRISGFEALIKRNA